MSPRPQHSAVEVASRRSAIVESALDQIAQHGPEAVRMKDIAEAAELSVGTLQYYFGSRESLLDHAFSTHSSTVVDAIVGLTQEQGTAWERLQSSLRAVPRIGDLQRRSRVWIELVAASPRNEYLRDSVDAIFDTWSAHFRGLIAIGTDDGSFRPHADVDLIVDTLIAVIDGYDVGVAAGRSAATSDRIAASLELTAGRLLGIDDTVAAGDGDAGAATAGSAAATTGSAAATTGSAAATTGNAAAGARVRTRSV
ncbi:TetR/AcrR family transcriptional regulator [Brevibacterium sp. UCMA 11754]|uniref:TetR/AcrR family transcriptional regulator n=1 Tax=Brevibacterium sp. UCMA 11754 TaxID=2749198 RepID=UPI001F42C274|nr:TetR/AcrR family transcriptional regulator [Brevibacterium sp. UCMA 11754]MCF2572951.1 TetR/AcrR family transcriptional regulator [Brevibacterium sp. UCMA 11754]